MNGADLSSMPPMLGLDDSRHLMMFRAYRWSGRDRRPVEPFGRGDERAGAAGRWSYALRVDVPKPVDEELTTVRLSLRRPIEDDIDAIFAIHSDPATCVHNPSDALADRDHARQLYRLWDDRWVRDGYGYWVVRHRDVRRQLGFCGVKPVDLAGMKILNLFYRFDSSTWGNGMASEAATAVAAWAARRVPDLPLVARVRPDNIASQRVAVRAGLSRAEHLDGPGYDGFDWIFAVNLPDSQVPR